MELLWSISLGLEDASIKDIAITPDGSKIAAITYYNSATSDYNFLAVCKVDDGSLLNQVKILSPQIYYG